MNFLQTYLIFLLRVAENIITYLLCGVFLKIFYTSPLMSNYSSILSHSSKTKCLILSNFMFPFETKSKILPGVPTTICGGSSFNNFFYSSMLSPPKKTFDLISGKNLPSLENSLLI